MRGVSLSDFKRKVIRTEDDVLNSYKYYINPALKEANKINKSREQIDKIPELEALELDSEEQK